MVLEGRIFKDAKFWLAEIPVLDAMTQGFTKEELQEMVIDLIKTMIDKPDTKVTLRLTSKTEFEVTISPSRSILPVVLLRQRMKHGLTIREVADNLGYANHNNYAAYESGKIEPGVEKFEELLAGIIPKTKKLKSEPIILKIAVGT
jgi:hypothetical protein